MALTDQLISFWKLNESSGNAADSVGTKTLTNTGSVAYSTGIYGNAAVFDGTAKYLNNAAEPGIANGAWTISAWVKFSALPSGQNFFVVSIGDAVHNLTYNVYYREDGSKRLRVERVRDGVAVATAEEVVTLSTGTWYFLTATFDGTNLILYRNASNVASTTQSGDGGSGTTAGTVIGATTGLTQYATMSVDAVGVWTRAISSGEVTTLYNAGVGTSAIEYPFVGPLSPSVTDSTAVSDAPSLSIANNLVKTDSSAVSDAVVMSLTDTINVNDSTSVSDAPTLSFFWPNGTKHQSIWTTIDKS